MKILKKIRIGSFVILFSFAGLKTVAHSESKNNNVTDISLYDIQVNFPILRDLYKSGYFSIDKYNINLMNDGENELNLNLKGIELVSNIKNDNGRDDAIFNLYTKNSYQTIKFTWDVPLEDAEDIFYHKPVDKLLDLAIEAKEKDINELICEDVSRGFIQIVSQVTNGGNEETEKTEKNDTDTYDIKISSGPSSRHRFFRTLGELVFLNSFGVVNYWINKHENMEDWEYKPDREGFEKKITDGWSLDTNAFRTNTIYHIYSGAVYYQAGRSNEYGFLASVAWAFTGSLIWEYIGEFREQVSTNDMIFTTMGGAVCGEALRQASLYFEDVLPAGFFRYFVITLLDPMRIINRAIDRYCFNDIEVRMTIINPVQAMIFKPEGRSGNITGAGISLRW